MQAVDPANVAGAVIRFGMAIVFAQSALHAARGWTAHVEAVRAYRLVPAALTVPAAAAALLTNLAIAMLLLAPARGWEAAAAGCLPLLLYAAAIQTNLARGRTHIECGCGGAAGDRISSLLVLRNVTLASLLAAAALCPPRLTDDVAPIALGGAVSFAALYFAASQLLANHAAFRAGAART
jgi:hypothetical protein